MVQSIATKGRSGHVARAAKLAALHDMHAITCCSDRSDREEVGICTPRMSTIVTETVAEADQNSSHRSRHNIQHPSLVSSTRSVRIDTAAVDADTLTCCYGVQCVD